MIPGERDRREHLVSAVDGFYMGRSRSVNFLRVRAVLVAAALAHRFAAEMDLVGAVQQSVEDGVGQRRVTDVVMPMFERQLAGDERGADADAIVEQFE